MPTVTISCPKCSADLKLPDRKLLGRKGKCPRCEYRFVLTEPDEVELTLLEAESPDPPAAPMVGTSAKWVPDTPPTSVTSSLASESADAASPDAFDFLSPPPPPQVCPLRSAAVRLILSLRLLTRAMRRVGCGTVGKAKNVVAQSLRSLARCCSRLLWPGCGGR